MRKFQFVLGATLLALLAGAIQPVGASAAVAATTCLPNNPVAPAHAPTNLSPSGISGRPSQSIGQAAVEPAAPGQPAWNGDDRVNDLIQIGNTVYAAGYFKTWIWNGANYPRQNIVAFDATTGQPTAFAPQVNNEIFSLAPACDGSAVFIGGTFTSVNGQARQYAAEISIATAAPTVWNPTPSGWVNDVSVMHGHLVVSGFFTRIGGTSRTNWASFDPNGTSSVPDGWLNIPISGSDPAGPQKVTKVVANHQGNYAVVIGNFNMLGGQDHRRIGVISLTDTQATLLPWATPITAPNNNANIGTDCRATSPAPELDVAWNPSDTNFFIDSTGGAQPGETDCDAASKWDGTDMTNQSAMPLGVEYTGGDSLSAIACTDQSCFVSGHERWANNPPLDPKVPVSPCSLVPPKRKTGYAGYNCKGPDAVDRPGVYEINMQTWHVTAWNPTRSKQVGMHNSMMITPQGLWIGSDGDYAAGILHNDMVLFPFTR
jgi:hypothetical protein